MNYWTIKSLNHNWLDKANQVLGEAVSLREAYDKGYYIACAENYDICGVKYGDKVVVRPGYEGITQKLSSIGVQV